MASTAPQAAPATPVGKMRVALERSGSAADVVVTVRADPDIVLDKIGVIEQRPGFLALILPPLESWADRLAWLPRDARERIESGACYERLLEAVRARWLRDAHP